MFGMSCVDMPAQSVAQKTKLCSFAIALMLPAVTSLALPSSPWPYSDGRAGVTCGPSAAARGIRQVKLAAIVLPGMRCGTRLARAGR